MRTRSAPTSARPGNSAVLQDFAPGEHRVAGEQRRDVPAAVDRGDVEGVGEAVEAQRARERDDVAAIDQPAAEPALALAELVEMHLGGVLVEAGREHVLGFLDRHAVDMVDLLADRIIAEAMRRAGEREIVGAFEHGQAAPSVSGATRAAVCGMMACGRGRVGIALAHHHPAHIVDDRLAVLVGARRAHIDDAALRGSSFP